MDYNEFHGERISALGMGTMRLPTKDGRIDEAETFRMVDYAIERGVNYFDTAWSYHGGESESVTGRALARHPRERWLLASKLPGHETNPDFRPAPTFERQLQKCGVGYFDFYLLHNVCENSLPTYLDPDLRIMDYLLEQKEKGRIRHLGFSSHARPGSISRCCSRSIKIAASPSPSRRRWRWTRCRRGKGPPPAPAAAPASASARRGSPCRRS